MDVTRILNELRAERGRIDQAIAALEAIGSATAQPATRANRGRPKKQSSQRQGATDAASAKGGNGRRRLSAAARKAISDAAKRRWAEHRNRVARKAAA